MIFGVGQRVFVFKRFDGNSEIINKFGTIVRIQENWFSEIDAKRFGGNRNLYGIAFDEHILGHSCSGRCKHGHGYNISNGCFRLANINKRI